MWRGAVSYARQWQRCGRTGTACATIPHTNLSTYTVAAADVGNTLRVIVTATGAGGKASAASSATPVVAPANRPGEEAAEAGRLSFLIALAFLAVGFPVLVWLLRSAWWLLWGQRNKSEFPALFWGRSLFVGADNRVSASKTTALVWTYTVAAALASFIIAMWLGHEGALNTFIHQGVDLKYALLVGGPLGAAILAKGIVSAQLENGQTAKPESESKPTPGQLVQTDTGEAADLGNVQYLLFNIVAALFFYGTFLKTPQAGLPTMPDALVGLTSLAAVGYVAKKALNGPPVITSVDPPRAAIGQTVTLLTSGLARSGDDLSKVNVKFGSIVAHPDALNETSTQGVLLDVTVPDGIAGKTTLTVAVPNGKSASWPEFGVLPKVDEANSILRAQPNAQAKIVADGIAALAPRYLDLAVTIGSQTARWQADNNDPRRRTLDITVPAGLTIPDGANEATYPLVIETPGGPSQPVDFAVVR